MSSVLYTIYPHEDLVERVYELPGDDITEAYLKNLLRTDPKNPRLRLLLARRQIESGQYGAVRETVGPALSSDDPALKREAAWLLWQSMERQFAALPATSPLRPALRAELDSRLQEMAAWDLPENDLADIARKAFALGNRSVGMGILERLARQNPNRSAYWFGEAADEALASGEYRSAAEFHLAAARLSRIPLERRRHFMAALRTLQSGNQLAAALEMADGALKEMPELGQDPEVLTQLVNLAREGGRPDLADRYVRPLLRMTLLRQWQGALLAAQGFDALPRRVVLAGEEAGKGPNLPFDDRIYTLGFQVFLENRKPNDAWKVAASAVRQAPDNLVWRERLAQVSEWTSRPRQALENWLIVARESGQDAAWQAVLRLAPGLYDDDALAAALQYQLGRHPGDRKLVAEMANLYERRGDPQGAIAFLERQARRHPWVLERMAELAERSGDDALAIGYWQRHFAQAGDESLPAAQAVKVATLMLRRGQTAEALAILEKARPAGAGEGAFLRLKAQVAQMARRDDRAVAAYRRMIDDQVAEEQDYEALFALLSEDYPLEAARLAAASWRRFGKSANLIRAIGIYSRQEQWSDMAALVEPLDAKQVEELSRQPEFLLHSARYHQSRHALRQAKRELETALGLAPQSPEVRQALLWLLIDSNDAPGVRGLLAARESEWRSDDGLQDALASAYQFLSLPDVALKRYLTPRLAGHREDFLWLMNYADALEQNQESDRAWRIRQYLLSGERHAVPGPDWLTNLPDRDTAEIRRIARARLAISLRQGDTGLETLRELLRLDGGRDGKLSRAAAEVAAAWLQDGGHYHPERGWLWQQFAKSASRPLWADISVALAEDDRERVGQLLDQYGEALPRYDRINAARRVDDVRLAQSDAFDTQEFQPDDNPLHLQLTDALLAHSDHAGAELVRRDLGSVGEMERAARWHVALTPRLTLDLALGSISRENQDTAAIGATPSEHYRSARLTWRHQDGETRFLAEDRHSFAGYRPLQVEHTQRIDEKLSVNFALGSDLPSTESIPLRLAGMKDQAEIGLRYHPSRLDSISLSQTYERYHAQTGDSLGDGRHLQIEYARGIRLEPRDLEASVFWSDHRFGRRDGAADARLLALLPADSGATAVGSDFFIPDSFRFYGVRLSTDVRFQREYTRAWRPYATVSRTWNTLSGPGYDIDTGIAGSVVGADHLRLGWRLVRAGVSTGGFTREIGLTYRVHY
ncbi:MAG TPA: tetratricopeptide repeat protein [Rhodocyclaceae bacterium]|nr:tetratricopeptide repeat protein [Rhodocyclaceae bacterium]